MKDLLEYVVKSIVNNPNDVVVTVKESVDFPGLEILTIKVADEDKGVIIGRKGRTINAIRDIMTISAIRNSKRIKVLVDEGEPRERDNRDNRDNRRQEVVEEVRSDNDTEDMLSDEI